MSFKNMFKKGNIGNIELKNRTVMPAISCFLLDEDNKVDERIISYYEERAKSGCGLIITGMTRIDDETGVLSSKQLKAVDIEDSKELKKIVDVVHKYDTKIFLQLSHPGRQTSKKLLNGKNIIAPSAIPCKKIGEVPEEMSIRQIQVLINRFAIGAKIAQISGMDGIEIDAAHGYLISQFISSNTNKRKDKYGGNIYNKLNFLKEIIEGVREFCGKDFPVSVRINSSDLIEDGLSELDAVEVTKIISTFPIDVLNISFGTYDSLINLKKYDILKNNIIKNIKENIEIPIIICNNIKTLEIGEKLLSEEKIDFIGLGRAQLSDGEFIKKSKENRVKEINLCISCLHCLESISKGLPVECSVNTKLGNEYKYKE